MWLPHLTSSCYCEERSDAAVSYNSLHSISCILHCTSYAGYRVCDCHTCLRQVRNDRRRCGLQSMWLPFTADTEIQNTKIKIQMRVEVYVIATTCFQHVSQWQEKMRVTEYEIATTCFQHVSQWQREERALSYKIFIPTFGRFAMTLKLLVHSSW